MCMYMGFFISLVGAIWSYSGVRYKSARKDHNATLVVSCVTSQGKATCQQTRQFGEQTQCLWEEESDGIMCVLLSGTVLLVLSSSAPSEVIEGRIIN